MNKEIRYINFFYFSILFIITFLISGSLLWSISKENNTDAEFAKIECEANYNKDIIYRRWAAMHGGVYVPPTSKTPPNKYLKFIPDRDITSTTGKKLTLINPAYMTRQVHEIGADEYGSCGHITSLKPIRPENKADQWESKALKAFENGAKEYSEIEKIQGKEYMRYMRPMITEKACLKCHEMQNYKLGDIRGGISVSVPMQKFRNISNKHIKNLASTHLIVYIILIITSFIGFRKLKKEMHRRNIIQNQIIQSEKQLKKQNEENISLNEEYKTQNEELVRAKNKLEEASFELRENYQELSQAEEELRASHEQLVCINDNLQANYKELERTKQKADESDQLKTAFLQNMSHEIRTPMNAICGFSALLSTPTISDEKRKNFIRIIQSSSNQLLSIVNDILTISSIDTHQEKILEKPIVINNLLDDIFSIYSQQCEHKELSLNIQMPLNDQESEIYSDKNKIQQILSNLITNAIKFTAKGSIIYGYTKTTDFLEFFVKDSGIGIKPEMHEKIFERFRQADENIHKIYGGTGLGLSISKGFVELLGGKIWLESEVDKGTCFYFTIPYKPVDNNKNETNTSANIELKNCVLVAEDEDFNYQYIEEFLLDYNLELLHAWNGKEAIQLYKENPHINLILMDIKMPVMDGYQAAGVIKQINPNTPIIAQSAYALEHERAKYEEIFNDYITKPINENEFNRILKKYLFVPDV